MTRQKKLRCSKATRDYAAWQYQRLAEESVKALFGVVREFGGWTMTHDHFSTTSWARDSRDAQYDVRIDFNANEVAVTEIKS